VKDTKPCNVDVPEAEPSPSLLTEGRPGPVTRTYFVDPSHPLGIRDEILCEVPLPDRESPEPTRFYTTSCPDPNRHRYTITKTGRLTDGYGNDREPDGYIEFYTRDKIRGAAKADSCVQREYRARFSAGQLQTITRVPNDEEEAYYELSSFRWFNTPPGPGPIRHPRRRRPKSGIGGSGTDPA